MFTKVSDATYRAILPMLGLALLLMGQDGGCGGDGGSGDGGTGGAGVAGVFYTFTSGPVSEGGDGFDWPASPPGLLDDSPSTSFTTPDGVQVFHDIGNNLFFDSNYLLPDDQASGNGIVGDAIWGNPRTVNSMVVEAVLFRFDPPAESVAFDFAWVQGPAEVFIAVGETAGGEFALVPLDNAFPGGTVFQNATGYSARVELSLDSLRANYDIDISGIYTLDVFVDEVSTEAGTAAFAIDNLATNGAGAP